MSSVSDIQQAVQALPEEEFAVFSSWFEQYEEERWDRQMERDQELGAAAVAHGEGSRRL